MSTEESRQTFRLITHAEGHLSKVITKPIGKQSSLKLAQNIAPSQQISHIFNYFSSWENCWLLVGGCCREIGEFCFRC